MNTHNNGKDIMRSDFVLNKKDKAIYIIIGNPEKPKYYRQSVEVGTLRDAQLDLIQTIIDDLEDAKNQ